MGIKSRDPGTKKLMDTWIEIQNGRPQNMGKHSLSSPDNSVGPFYYRTIGIQHYGRLSRIDLRAWSKEHVLHPTRNLLVVVVQVAHNHVVRTDLVGDVSQVVQPSSSRVTSHDCSQIRDRAEGTVLLVAVGADDGVKGNRPWEALDVPI
jgi:hypothetical protein